METILNPVTFINETGDSDWLLICEHASQCVPPQLKQLGLQPHHLNEHIAYDIGAYEMTQALVQELNATAICCNYSRLVIDCNRTLTAPDCIPTVSDGITIPGNIDLDSDDRLLRINGIYQPFHTAIFHTIADRLVHHRPLKIANIHSFTPMLSEEGFQRPWDIGFIYRDPNPTQQIIRYLQENTDYTIGDNQPYNGVTHKGYTLPVHADAHDLPGILVEFRQDLIDTPQGIAHWSALFATALRQIT